MLPLFISTFLLIVLSLLVGSSISLCLPCSTSNRRSTSWDALLSRGVYTPNITNPMNSTVWTTGSEVAVTWNHRDMPDKTSNPKGILLLGYLEDGSDDEHLNYEHPLASDFRLKDGYVNFVCPKTVEPGENYIVVLFGDSGNRSDRFTIRK